MEKEPVVVAQKDNNCNCSEENNVNNVDSDPNPIRTKKIVSLEGFMTIGFCLLIFLPIGIKMGFGNMLQTLFNNAHSLLLDTCFYLMAVAVVIGAFSAVLTEFGVIALANKALSPLMKPLFGMPGATSMAMFSAFLSDNPAVLTLAEDKRYRMYFKKYQLAGLTNLGTAFGMGLIVIITLSTKTVVKGNAILAVIVGLIGAIAGSIVATRLMLLKSKKRFGKDLPAEVDVGSGFDIATQRQIREGGAVRRVLDSMLDGGASGVKIGLAIIPGVLIIANLVMLLTNGTPANGYTGAAGEGVGIIPKIGDLLRPIMNFLFGFEHSSAISVPLTALGSAGAAIGLVADGVYSATELAVFTSMCMFWSGYLSTHVSMMDSMGFREFTTSSILFHTIGGIVAGFVAHWLYALIALII